jgi:hypothetical protein
MSSRRIRKIAALVMATVVAVGLTTHEVGRVAAAGRSGTDVTMTDMSMSTDAPMPGKCNGCAGDEKGVAPAACSAFCSAVIALGSAPAILLAGPAETLRLLAGRVSAMSIPPIPIHLKRTS